MESFAGTKSYGNKTYLNTPKSISLILISSRVVKNFTSLSSDNIFALSIQFILFQSKSGYMFIWFFVCCLLFVELLKLLHFLWFPLVFMLSWLFNCTHLIITISPFAPGKFHQVDLIPSYCLICFGNALKISIDESTELNSTEESGN